MLIFLNSFFFFSVQLEWFPLLCLLVHWSIPLYHLIYYWFFWVYFFISVIVFFSSVWFFFIFSNSLLEISSFLLCSSFFSQVLWASLWLLPWTIYWVGCLCLLYLVLLGFCLVLSFGTYSSVASFCLFSVFISMYLIGWL